MDLRVVGAGLPRTGTTSLKAALEQLLGGPCYHMVEFFPRAERQIGSWHRVFDGDVTQFAKIFDGSGEDDDPPFVAAVDWPASAVWQQLADANPKALVVLSHRSDADAWWKSVNQTVWEGMRRETGIEAFDSLSEKMRAAAGLGADWDDETTAKAMYTAHLDNVRAAIAPGRLLEWQPGDGWAPLCAALDLPVPDTPFPHLNPTAEFRSNSGWD